MKKEQFDITEMTCSACSFRVEGCVVKLPGVKNASVNLLKNSMVVSYDEAQLSTAGIVEAVEHSGYGATLKKRSPTKSRSKDRSQQGSGRIQVHEAASHAFCSVHNPAVLHLHGSHDELAP